MELNNKKKRNIDTKIEDELARFIATGAYIGYLPGAPGTWGSGLGLLLSVFSFKKIADFSFILYCLTFLGLIALGIWAADKMELIFQKKDAPQIVIDEICGFLVAMFMLPVTLLYLVSGFFLFRAIDTIKPYPAYQSQQVTSGLGVMLDDLIAGVYTNIVLQLVRIFISF